MNYLISCYLTVSCRYSLLTLVSEAMCYLIYPFRWQVRIGAFAESTLITMTVETELPSYNYKCVRIDWAISVLLRNFVAYKTRCRHVAYLVVATSDAFYNSLN